MASLFRVIGSIHKVPEEQVRRSLGHRRIPFDLAVFLSFAVLYAWGTSLLARWLCRIYGPREGLLTIAIMTVLVALLASVAGVMLGEMWSWTWETHRFGNHHMSYRAARIPWTHHRLELFIVGTTIFLLIAGFHRRRAIATSFRTSKETHNLQG